MYHSGVGGGGFMTVRSAKGEYEFIDFREMAPGAAFVSSTYFSCLASFSNFLCNLKLPKLPPLKV